MKELRQKLPQLEFIANNIRFYTDNVINLAKSYVFKWEGINHLKTEPLCDYFANERLLLIDALQDAGCDNENLFSYILTNGHSVTLEILWSAVSNHLIGEEKELVEILKQYEI